MVMEKNVGVDEYFYGCLADAFVEREVGDSYVDELQSV